jgi:Bacterial PH domain/Short C-terminal domain
MSSDNGGKGEDSPKLSSITDITDENELNEIQRITDKLGKDEKVIFVARQSRFKPGGSKGSPATLFVTSKRLIYRNPSMFGLHENISVVNYDRITSMNIEKGVFSSTLKIKAEGFAGDMEAIDKKKAESILSYIKEKIDQTTHAVNDSRADSTSSSSAAATSDPQLSAVDELAKLAKLKEQGVLSEAEFNQMKQEILKKF